MKTQFFSISLLVVLVFSFSSVLAQKNSSTANYCHFVGTINGNLPIIMDLVQEGKNYSGTYYYTKYNLPIRLEGQMNTKGEIELSVFDDKGEKTEVIIGKTNQTTFIGNWYNKDKSKKLPISLVEDYSKSISFNFVYLKDSIKLIDAKKVSPRAIFSETFVEINQVPQASNLKKIKELIQKRQDINFTTTITTTKQILEKNKTEYFKEYKEENKDFEEEYSYMSNWEKQSGVNVLFNDNYFTTLSFFMYQYSGGAHGGYSENFLIIDTKSGKEITLNDIFDATALPILEKRMIKKAYTYAVSENATSLEDAGYLVDKIEATNNILLHEKGITFVYQQYEISPYSMGMPSFMFTWDEIKDLIKTDSPVHSLIKKQ